MEKLYNVDEIKDVSYKAYQKMIVWLRKNVGNSSSDEALIRYAKQADYKVSIDGTLYERVN